MNYTELTDDQLRDHLRQIETVLKERGTHSVPVIFKTVLIVDDDWQVSRLLRITLDIGYQIHVAYNATSALECAREYPPDICLIDWVLNGDTGGELCYQLRQMFPNIPLVILSGYEISQVEAELVGATMRIKKPYSPIGLVDIIEKLLEKS